MISQASIQEVMHRANIVEVVGQFVRLKKRGSAYIANCPFHNEKTPSFNVTPAKGIYKCFGCGKAGDSVSFLQEHEKLTYPEAIHWLADFYKIELEETERTPEQVQQQQSGEALRILNEFATKYFHEILLNHDEGKLIGLSYFQHRGFRKDIIEKFRLGYNIESGDDFYREATHKGYKTDILEKAGLIKNRNGIFHDVYRGRVVFPIQNMTGRIVGFGARILKSNDKAPKYINTPENELYIKHKILYGIFQSRQAIAKVDECFLVEGYTDVISLHQGGVENVVASSGTSLTEDQLRLIGQLTKNLTILYDGDPAGIKAALRGLDMALSQSFNVQLVLLPNGEDPDSYIQKTGAAEFIEYVKGHKQNIISFRVQVGLQEVGNDPVKKSKLTNEIAESISKINKTEDFVLQTHFIKEASTKLGVEEAGLINLVNKYIRDRIESENRTHKEKVLEPVLPDPENLTAEPPFKPPLTNTEYEQEWQLLRVLIEYGHLPFEESNTVAEHIRTMVDTSAIIQPIVLQLYNEYYHHLDHFGSIPEIHYFIHHSDEWIREKMVNLLHPKQEISENWEKKYEIKSLTGHMVYFRDVQSTISYFELKKVLKLLDELNKKIEQEKEPTRLQGWMEKFLEYKTMEKDIIKKHGTVVYKSLKHKF